MVVLGEEWYRFGDSFSAGPGSCSRCVRYRSKTRRALLLSTATKIPRLGASRI